MTPQEINSKYPIVNFSWAFDNCGFITRTSMLRHIGPFDPWNQRLTLLGCATDEDGLGEVEAWYPMAVIDGNQVKLTIVNDSVDLVNNND